MNIYQPYTYHIAWSGFNKHYYGVRYARNCNPNDLWVKYFTSSKEVAKLREELGEPDIIEIRKVFPNKDNAIDWEHKVLRRMQVITNESWLNKSFSEAPRFHEAHREKHLDAVRGRKYSDKGKDKLREARKKQWEDPDFAASRQQAMQAGVNEESKAKIAAYQTGRTRSDETKKRMAEGTVEQWKVPGYKEKVSKAVSNTMKEKWADPEYRAKMMEARRKKKLQ